ncbi:ATP-binding cassette domain-containing protein [Pseudoroseomonas wenyumeiae]
MLVREVSLVLEPGQVLGLVGTSGGGKSLTVLAMLGLLPRGLRQVAGRLRHAGRVLDAAGVAALRGGAVGLVQQSPRACFNPIVTIGRHFAETLGRGALDVPRRCSRRSASMIPRPSCVPIPFSSAAGCCKGDAGPGPGPRPGISAGG